MQRTNFPLQFSHLAAPRRYLRVRKFCSAAHPQAPSRAAAWLAPSCAHATTGARLNNNTILGTPGAHVLSSKIAALKTSTRVTKPKTGGTGSRAAARVGASGAKKFEGPCRDAAGEGRPRVR